MLKRAMWRVQPLSQFRKRKKRHREMLEREKQFQQFVSNVTGVKINDHKRDFQNPKRHHF